MNVRLIALREITSRTQQRGFRIGFAVTLLVVVVACVVPSFFSDDGPTKYDVAVTRGAASDTLARTKITTITVHRSDPGEARQKVEDGDWDAAVLPDGRVLAESSGDAVVGVVQAAYRSATLDARLRDAGLSGAEASRAVAITPLSVTTTESKDNSQREAIAVITVIVLFMQLITFVTWVAIGVVEEKSSRVVELVLSAVRPVQLLAGKLIGIGLLAAGQVLAIGVVALVAGTIAGTVTIPASAVAVVVVSFVGFVLGFAFFAAVAAALAATVSRQEEVSGVLTPVTLFLTLCYLASFATTSDPDGTLARVLSIVPPVSCIAMPARIAHGGVAPIDVVLAVLLLAGAAIGVIVVAARVYRASVLHSGTRVPLKRAWRGEAVASID